LRTSLVESGKLSLLVSTVCQITREQRYNQAGTDIFTMANWAIPCFLTWETELGSHRAPSSGESKKQNLGLQTTQRK